MLGCGQIGGQADLNLPSTVTYAKALSKRTDVEVSMFDLNYPNMLKLKEKYGFTIILSGEEINYDNFDLAIIALPSTEHFSILKELLIRNFPSIICEKPVCTNIYELRELQALHLDSVSQVTISYNRNHSVFSKKIREIITAQFPDQHPLNVSIRYQRGFLNNCSHALSLCQLLLNKKFSLNSFDVFEKKFDYFKTDPTLTAVGVWHNTSLVLNGLSHVPYPFLDILITYQDGFVSIFDCANKVSVQKTNTIANEDYMKPCDVVFEGSIDSNLIDRILENTLSNRDLNETLSDFQSIINMTGEMLKVSELTEISDHKKQKHTEKVL